MPAADPSGAAELVRRCVGGEPAAWADLVERYSRLVYSVPRRYGLSEGDAEDVMQAVFTAAVKSLPRIKEPEKLSAWLITSAHRESWRVGRQRGLGQELTDAIGDVSEPPEESVRRWDLQDTVHAALRELGGRCEELLRTLYFQVVSTSYEAISERLGMPMGSIGPTRARCLKKLEEILRGRGMKGERDDVPGPVAGRR